MFANSFAKPYFRPAINIGCMLDIPTGKYQEGKHGEMIMDGGLGPLTGITSRPNNFKTALAIFMMAMVRRCLPKVEGISYDSEGTLEPVHRLTVMSQHFAELRTIDWANDTQFAFTDLSRYSGDEFFKLFRDVLREKEKNAKQYNMVTPFVDIHGKNKDTLYPSVGLIDSFTHMQVTVVEAMYDKNTIGSSGNNTDNMALGKAKTQLFNQLPQLCARSLLYQILTAHTTDVINMEMFPTDKRRLSHMKQNTTIKGVGPGFSSLPNNAWSIEKNNVLQNRDKTPLYPRDNSTAMEGDTDLKILEIINLRGKGGITGQPIRIIVSQTEGIRSDLTDFHYCKENNWGIGGNIQNYYLELKPDVKLSRTVVNKKLAEDKALKRAAEIQSELLQLIQYQRWTAEQVCDPKTLYEDLTKMGYDWEFILNNTRNWWVPVEDDAKHPLKFLSTYDLLRMRTGEYKPYWMSKEDKAKIKPLDFVKATV